MGSAERCCPCSWECHLLLHSLLLCRTPKLSVLTEDGLHTFMNNAMWLGITVPGPWTMFQESTPEFQLLRREIQSTGGFFFPANTLPLLHFASLHCLFIAHLLCCVQVVKEQNYLACWPFNSMNTFHYFTCNRDNCVHCVRINRKLREISLTLENISQNTSRFLSSFEWHLASKYKLLHLSGCFSLSHRGSQMSMNRSLFYVWRTFSECNLQRKMSAYLLQCSVMFSLTFTRYIKQGLTVPGITGTSPFSIFICFPGLKPVKSILCQIH